MPTSFVLQPIPPFMPKEKPPASAPPPPPSLATPPASASSDSTLAIAQENSRRNPSATNGGTWPSVLDAPTSKETGGTKGTSETRRSGSSSSRVNEEQDHDGRRRRSDEMRNDPVDRRREDANESEGRSNHYRSSFSIPNPNARPALPTRSSNTTIASQTVETSPSPRSKRERALNSNDADTTESASKRARTSLGPLENLAATASGLLAADGSSTSHSRDHQAIVDSTQQLREQQQREIERRRIAAGGSIQPLPGSVGAALNTLRAQQQHRQDSNDSSMERSISTDRRRHRNEEKDQEEKGLGKRRGHRPPAVATGSNSAFSTTTAAQDDPLRSAPPGAPSVLAGQENGWPRGPSGTGQLGDVESSRRQSIGTIPPVQHRHHPFPSSQRLPSIQSSHSQIDHRQNRHQQSNIAPLSASQPKETGGVRLPPLNLVHPRPSPLASLPAHHPLRPASTVDDVPPSAPSPSFSYPPSSAPPSTHSQTHSQYGAHLNSLPTSPPGSAHSESRLAFVSLFATFFDSLTDSRILQSESRALQSTLAAQIARSSSLLATLQQSEIVLEQLVDQRMEQAQVAWRRDFNGLEARLAKIESSLSRGDRRNDDASSPLSNGFVGLGISQHPLEARMLRLEEMLARSAGGAAGGVNGELDDSGKRSPMEDSIGRHSLPTPLEVEGEVRRTGTSQDEGDQLSRSDRGTGYIGIKDIIGRD